MKKIYYHKLVRDKIPVIIKSHGANCKVRRLKTTEYKKELVKKLVEEAEELCFKGGNKQEVAKELADISEIIKALKGIYHLADAKIRKLARDKARTHGRFSKRLFLFWSEDGGYQSDHKKYQRN